jgi:hypothetical protein
VRGPCTDKKEKKLLLVYGEIQMGSVAKSYMRMEVLFMYEEMRTYLVINEEAITVVIYDFATCSLTVYMGKILLFFISVG